MVRRCPHALLSATHVVDDLRADPDACERCWLHNRAQHRLRCEVRYGLLLDLRRSRSLKLSLRRSLRVDVDLRLRLSLSERLLDGLRVVDDLGRDVGCRDQLRLGLCHELGLRRSLGNRLDLRHDLGLDDGLVLRDSRCLGLRLCHGLCLIWDY